MILESNTSSSYERESYRPPAVPQPTFSPEEQKPEQRDESLEEAARDERDYVRGRLREALGREPSEEEVDEWLRQHTEGY
jgi:hypothetical protein